MSGIFYHAQPCDDMAEREAMVQIHSRVHPELKLKKQLSAGIIRRLLAASSFVADANP